MASQSSVESEEKDLSMVKVDAAGLHEKDELSPWMSELFEKLDLEVDEDDDISSTEKMAQIDAHPLQKTSYFLQKWGTGPLSEERFELIHPAVRALIKRMEEKNMLPQKSTHDSTNECLAGIATGSQNSTNPRSKVRYCVPDEVYDSIVEEAKEYGKKNKRVSYEKTLENGMKWMSEECLLAFRNNFEKIIEGIEYKFGELRNQCFSYEAFGKIFHHYNFTVKIKHGNSDIWAEQLFFAEVKQLSSVKLYFCCPLEAGDNGHCYACKNQQMDKLKHPSFGDYEEGDADICYPFMDDIPNHPLCCCDDDSDMDDFY